MRKEIIMLEQKTQDKITRKGEKEGKMQKGWQSECWRKKSSLSKGCRQISDWTGRERGIRRRCDSKGLWLVEETKVRNKEHEDKRTCYTPAPASCTTHCFTKGSEHRAQQMD